MAEVKATSSATVEAPQDKVIEALADYEVTRPRILTEQFKDYRLIDGGHGNGTVAQWTLQATQKRSRDIKATVTVSGATITETDANSSLVTTWTVEPAGANTSTVTTTTRWNGAGGVGGFFEKTFAPLGLKKIQAQVLANLKSTLEG